MTEHALPAKPRPVATPLSQPFWDALRDERIAIQRCGQCSGWVHYPRNRCSHCLSDNLAFQQVGPRGTVYTFSVARQPTNAAFTDVTPLVIAIVELDDGPRLTTNIIGIDADDVRVGMAVTAVFDHGDDDMTLLYFRPTS